MKLFGRFTIGSVPYAAHRSVPRLSSERLRKEEALTTLSTQKRAAAVVLNSKYETRLFYLFNRQLDMKHCHQKVTFPVAGV